MDKKETPLSREHAERMRALHSLVVKALQEMGGIVAETLSLDLKTHAPVFSPHTHDETRLKMEAMTFPVGRPVLVVTNTDGTSTGCYLPDRGSVAKCGRPTDV
jgi:hypothetical protein